MLRSLMLAGTALFAVQAADAQTPAPASAPAVATADDSAGEIIVTAQKRRERLQDVPVAVSVVTGAALSSAGKVSLEGAQYLVPSLNFLKSGTTLNQSLFLRGVGTATFSIAGEPSVSTVLDGVVLSRAGEAFSDLIDIDRIEVLRGPQGTLFGKNASAGVINIVSVMPGDTLGGYVEAGFYTKSEYRARAAIDIPISPSIRTRVNAFYDDYNGNIYNAAPNVQHEVNGYKHYGVRAIVEADATENLKLTAIGDYRRANDDCCAEVIGTTTLNAAGVAVANPINAVLPTPKGDESRTISQDLVTRTKETSYGGSLQGDLSLGDFLVTSITAYRVYDNEEIRDGDFLPAAYAGYNQLHDDGPQVGHTFSQEVRLTSPAGDRLTYVLGAYYSRATSVRTFTRDDVVCTTTATVLTPCSSPLASPSTTPSATARFGSTFENVAVFGQGTYKLTDNFRAIGGLRFTHDKLDVFETRVTTLAGPGINPSFGPFTDSASKSNLSGKGGFQYDLSHNSTAYATYARGYKGPAYNVFFNLAANGTNTIAPETSNAYEIGLKNTLFGGKLTINLAGYYAKYHNFQANNPDLVAGVVVTRFTNAGTVSTRGGELDMLYRPLHDLTVSGGLAYTDAHVDEFKIPVGAASTAVIPSGTPLGFAPKFKASLGADYRIRTSGIVDFLVGAQTSYQSKELSLFSADPVQRKLGTIDGYGLVNLSFGVTDHADKYKLMFQVRNLLDQSFAAAISNGGPGGSYRYQIPRDADRYYGVTGRVNF